MKWGGRWEVSAMTEAHTIEFTLRTTVDGEEVSPATIGLSLFNRFNGEVEEFLAGSDRRVSLDHAHVSIEDGSYRLLVALPATVAALLEPDLRQLQSEGALDRVDSRRAKIVRTWQDRALREEMHEVTIRLPQMDLQPVRISHDTDFHSSDQDQWVAVEKYVLGRVVDIGGTARSNVHVILDDTGKRLIAESTEQYLREQRRNFLYHRVQLRIRAEENTLTGELRNERLLEFVGEGPSYDEQELEQLVEKGTRSWADVPDSVAWVREQRGGDDG